MLYQNSNKHSARPSVSFVFAAILTIAFLLWAGNAVKSRNAVDFTQSPFEFGRNLRTKKESSNKILAPSVPGELDPTFYNGGKIATDFSSHEAANAVALQADGKIVAAGYFAGDVNDD